MRILLERLADNAQWGRAVIASASVPSLPVQAAPLDTDSDEAMQGERLLAEKNSKKLH
jgi:hypothetical protein